MEKAMAPHSSTLAWKIPGTEEPRRLQSMGLLRVGHDWATSLFSFMHWRRKWQPTPAFLPGESQGQGSLVGCRLWGHTESDTTEVTQQQQDHFKLESRLLGEISITSDVQMIPPLWQKVKRNWRASWWLWKRRVKNWLKTQHSKN